MIRAFATKRLRLILADACRNPHARLLVHREAVRIRLARPDRLFTPIWRGFGWWRIGLARRLRVAHLELDLGGRVLDRIDDGHVVGARLERPVDRAACLEAAAAPRWAAHLLRSGRSNPPTSRERDCGQPA